MPRRPVSTWTVVKSMARSAKRIYRIHHRPEQYSLIEIGTYETGIDEITGTEIEMDVGTHRGEELRQGVEHLIDVELIAHVDAQDRRSIEGHVHLKEITEGDATVQALVVALIQTN